MPWTEEQYRAFITRRMADSLKRSKSNPVLDAEPVTTNRSALRSVGGRTGIANVPTGAKSEHEIYPPVGELPDTERKRPGVSSLVRRPSRSRKSKGSVVARVAIISLRRKALDGDNLQTGAKWLRDEISKQLGCDDAEGAGIEFEYSQVITKGEEGVIVRVEAL